jgi:predicted ATPase
VEAEFLYQRGLPPQATYLFKHALIQDAAYQSLLRSTRQQHHQRIAQVLEERFPDLCETQPELLAQHYTEAGLTAQAIPYWQQGGQRAIERSAYVEAISHLRRGLELFKTLPDAAERAQQELTLQLALGAPLLAVKGHGAPEVEQTYARAREMCQQVGETSQLVSALLGLFAFYLVRPEFQTTRELGEQLFTLAENVQDPGLFVVAHRMLGTTLFYLGEVSAACERLHQGLALYTAQQHLPAYFYGQDVQVYCRVYAAMALWLLGYPEQALQTIQQARTQALAYPFSQAVALDHSAWVHQYRREAPLVQERAEAALVLSREQGFAMYVAIGTVLRGWALAKQAQPEEGIAQICQGLAACRSVGLELLRPYFLAMLAEAYGDAGQIDAGLAVLAEALAVTENTGERCWEAEQYRLQGECSGPRRCVAAEVMVA